MEWPHRREIVRVKLTRGNSDQSGCLCSLARSAGEPLLLGKSGGASREARAAFPQAGTPVPLELEWDRKEGRIMGGGTVALVHFF